jgi:hypothetical protein
VGVVLLAWDVLRRPGEETGRASEKAEA